MRSLLRLGCALALCALHALPLHAGETGFRFGVLAHAAGADDQRLAAALAASDADNLAFVVVNGLKAAAEPCSDRLYARRADLLQRAQNGVIVSLAASDWTECRGANGRPAAVSRLALLRDTLFVDEFSLGASRIPVIRQSTNPRFRSYVENARWELGEMMFATVNLPANNNNYLTDAGRNSEFEDRTVANREWLQRIFVHARQKKMKGIVLFCDANPLVPQRQYRRDGYLEIRRQLASLAGGFDGRVLIVYAEADKPASSAIRWQGRLGELNAGSGAVSVAVEPDAPWFLLAQAESAGNGR
jgi:hypothetical protein